MPSGDLLIALGVALAPTCTFVVIGVIAWRKRHARHLPDTPANPSVTTSSTR